MSIEQLPVAKMNEIIVNLVLNHYKRAVDELIRVKSEVAAQETTEKLEDEFENRRGYSLGRKFQSPDQAARRKAQVDKAQAETDRWEQILKHTMTTFIADKEG